MNTQYKVGLVAVLVLGALLVAGCTSPSTTSPTPSAATQTVGTRDSFLDNFLVSLEREVRNNTTVSSWVVKWQNASAVSIQAQFRNVRPNEDLNLNRTLIRFASIIDATNYVNANNLGYVATTNLTKAYSLPYRAYELTKGSVPTVYSAWVKPGGLINLRRDAIQQLDDVVIIDSASLAPSSSAVTT